MNPWSSCALQTGFRSISRPYIKAKPIRPNSWIMPSHKVNKTEMQSDRIKKIIPKLDMAAAIERYCFIFETRTSVDTVLIHLIVYEENPFLSLFASFYFRISLSIAFSLSFLPLYNYYYYCLF